MVLSARHSLFFIDKNIYIVIYISQEVMKMELAKVFENGRSQAVRLPKKYRFQSEEVVVQQLGDAVILVPKDSLWQTFMDGLAGFSDDIFAGGREQGAPEERGSL